MTGKRRRPRAGDYVRHHQYIESGINPIDCDNVGKVRRVETVFENGGVSVRVRGLGCAWERGDFEVLSPHEAAFYLLAAEDMA